MFSPRPAVKRPGIVEFFRLLNSPSVKVFVGDRAEPYILLRDLLAHFSPYFRACCNGNFKEGVDGILRLPDDEPAYFEALIDWMRANTAQLHITKSVVTPADQEAYDRNIDEDSLVIRKCLDFIEFCDKYDICEAAALVAHLVRQYTGLADYETVMPITEFCYGRLHPDNPVLVAMTEYAVELILDGGRKQ